MDVYRIEHSQTRYGPYTIIENENGRHPGPLHHYGSKALHDEAHPYPDEDGIDRLPAPFASLGVGKNAFGFKSCKQLLAWFKPYWRDLKGKCFVVARYKVEKGAVVEGKHQLVFNAERATREECEVIK